MERVKDFFLSAVFFVMGVLVLLTASGDGYAATFTVNSTGDAVDAVIGDGICQTATTGECTLRAAVQEANASAGVADTINLPAGTITLTTTGAGEELAATGDLDIGVNGVASAVTIVGQGAASTIIDGNGTDRVFETLATGSTATISGLTIRNGNSGALDGGCLKVGGNTAFDLSDAVVTGCTAAQGGGGIDNTGTLTMNVVAVTGNSSPGGGALNGGAASTTIWTNGEASGNTDRGINNSGTMTLTNVTVSGNTTAGNGGGIDNDGPLILQFSTISANTSTNPVNVGGLRNRAPGIVTVANTIIAGNTPVNCDLGAGLLTLGNNIDDGTSCVFDPTTDLSNTDPLLGPLALNGGELKTHAVTTAGSPAVDAGANAGCPATDARGVTRPVDGNVPLDGTATCDIGAFEFRPQTISLAPASIAFGTVSIGLTSTQTVTVTNTGDGGLTGFGIVGGASAPPFTIVGNLCTNPVTTLALGQSCAMTVEFKPTAAVASSHTFTVQSNDPATPNAAVAATGTGAAGPVPNISVTDSIAPATDLTAPFGAVAIGVASEASVTVTNTGTANLVIGTVASANPLAAPFSKTGDTCSGQTIAPNATCAITIRFAPSENISSSDSFDIPSNDPDTPTITVSLTGSGVSAATGNNPPSPPVLLSPENGAVVSGTTVTLTWQESTDADGDTVTYHVYNCDNADPTACAAVDVAAAGFAGPMFAVLGGFGGGILLLGFVGLGRSRRMLLILGVVVLAGALLGACSSSDNGGSPAPTPQQGQYVATGLTPGTTYYWKVVADDGKGGTASSEIRNYTVQ